MAQQSGSSATDRAPRKIKFSPGGVEGVTVDSLGFDGLKEAGSRLAELGETTWGLGRGSHISRHHHSVRQVRTALAAHSPSIEASGLRLQALVCVALRLLLGEG